jgi:long-chain acyl-CoA synthetase
MSSRDRTGASPHHNVAALLARTAAAWPRVPALAAGRFVLADYASFAHGVRAIGAGLRAHGLQPGERVALIARNQPEYVEAMFACWWAGLVAVPVNAKLHVRELEYVLDHSGARLAFVDAAWIATLGGVADAPPLVELGSPEYRALRRDGPASTSRRSAATTRRGSSIPAAPRAGRRASSSRTATCARWPTGISRTWLP